MNDVCYILYTNLDKFYWIVTLFYVSTLITHANSTRGLSSSKIWQKMHNYKKTKDWVGPF